MNRLKIWKKLIFGVLFLYEFAANRFKRWKLSNEEWVPLVNEKGEITGQAPRSAVHNGKKLLHPVVHLHFIDDSGKILLQKRPAVKLVQPGKWDTAVGGHISAGESLETALKRESLEETGVTGFNAVLLKIYRWETDIEAELVYMFRAFIKGQPVVQSAEVDELKFWSKSEIEKNMEKEIFTPNFIHEYRILVSGKLL